MASAYFRTSSCFENISKFTVITHTVEDNLIGSITSAINRVFKNIEKLDGGETDVVGLLWVFKTILNSTLIPLNDPSLHLKDRYENILSSLKKHNIDPLIVDDLQKSTEPLWSTQRNKKFDRLISILENSSTKSEPIGLVGKILYGDDLVCANLAISSLFNYGFNFSNIQTKRQLKDLINKTIFIVSPTTRASVELVKNIFYSGITSELNLVLYEHEKFFAPPRIELPISTEFEKNIKKYKPTKIFGFNTAIESADSELNSWSEEKFWIDIHGGSRTKIAQSIPAHYILFDNGEGAFMPAQGKVLHIDKSVTDACCGDYSYELSHVSILDLLEGDYVLLRKNSSGFLFNEEAVGIDDENNDGVLDEITDWKNALGALLLTKDYLDISVLMKSKGVDVNPAKIKQWEGIDVIAPNSEVEFIALIEVLGDGGKLSPSITDINKYAIERWSAIHEYRISRQKAGNRARQTILEGLLTKIEGVDIDSLDGSKRLDSQLGQNILIRRIASIDQSTSYVHQSRLYKIDDLRGNKWLR